MGYTLDQLLDETGVSDLAGSRLSKQASPEPTNFAKLAERCRRAAEATPEEQADAVNATLTAALVEKTAAIAIIGRTLAEIRAIEGEPQQKVAAPVANGPTVNIELFIKEALEQGHSPEEIAEFLDKTGGILDKVRGLGREFRAHRTLNKAQKLREKGEAAGQEAFRRFQDHVRKSERLGERERDALVSKMRIRLGDERAADLFADNPAFRNLPSAKGLKRATEATAEKAKDAKVVGVNLGKAQLGVSAEQLNKMKKPAALVGAGYLGHRTLSGGGDKSEKKRSGVVVVNS